MMLTSFNITTALHRRRRTPNHRREVRAMGFHCFGTLFGRAVVGRMYRRALGLMSCSFLVHGRLLSLQSSKTCRLQKPADQVPLEEYQHFCLWTGYHLAPRAVPRKRGIWSQSPAESPICPPSSVISGGDGISRGEKQQENRGTLTFILSFYKNYNAHSQLSKLQ